MFACLGKGISLVITFSLRKEHSRHRALAQTKVYSCVAALPLRLSLITAIL